MSEKTRGHDRTRAWAAVVYPDSAPENWRQLLDDQHIQWVESPLHEFDVNEGTGEVKKAHWHIVLAFDGVKSYEQVCDILAPLNCTVPQRCHSLPGAIRYMAHLDNPEKYQYSPSEIKGHGGFDVAAALVPTSAKRYELIREMQAWCFQENIYEFCDLLDYAAEKRFDDWYPLLCDSCAYVMTSFLKSRRGKREGRAGTAHLDKP